jgi:hypothetical protein
MKKQTSIPGKRKCKYPHCITILTIYNLGDACQAHTMPYFDLMEEKEEKAEQIGRPQKRRKRQRYYKKNLKKILKYNISYYRKHHKKRKKKKKLDKT